MARWGLAALMLGVAYDAYAQTARDLMRAELMTPPQLTVTFDLESDASDVVTDYYREIVKELLRSLPHRVELRGDNRSLLSGSQRYDRLQVIADVSAGVSPSTDYHYYFDIGFEAPRPDIAAKLAAGEMVSPAVVVHRDRLRTFLDKVATIRAGGEVAALAAKTAVPPTTAEQAAAAPQQVSVQQSLPIATKTAVPAKKAAPFAVKSERKTVTVTLSYRGDIASTAGLEKEIAQLRQLLPAAKRVTVVSRTQPAPFGGVDEVLLPRLAELAYVLDAAGHRLKNKQYQHIKLFSGAVQSLTFTFDL